MAKKYRRAQHADTAELITMLEDIAKKVCDDPKVKELSEEYQRKYGTLTEDDLKKIFRV